MSVENIVVDIEINNSIAPDIEQSIVATIDNNINVIKDDTDDLDVTINRKEYVITGDEIYIPKRYEDAPTWLQNMIDQVVEYSIGAKVSDMNQVVYSLNQMIEAMEVSKNTYEMSVISSNDIDTRINTAITTLNSNMNEADATILSVANTKTTPEEAEAIMINAVRAELESTEAGTIGAAVVTLSTAIANEEEARSTSVETLYSTMEGEIEATARAFNTINTYVGLDEVGASTGTGLSGYLEGSTGIVGEADSKVVNNVYVDALGNAKSKFEYGSIVAVNGINHIAGFGLSNSAGTDIGSEFWINAAKFKFTNDNKTGSKAPFTIDASGAIPQISFNGIVDFSNITNTTGTGSNLLYNSAPKIGSETKGWYVWTDSGMTVDLSAGWDVWKPTGGASVVASIGGNPSIGSVYDVRQSLKFPVIAGSRYEASAYISAHRSNSHIYLVFYDTAGISVGEAVGNVINYAGSNALVNWGRSSVFTTAPGNAATALLVIRSIVTGSDPYCFVTNAFTGVAEANQTTPSNWSEGTSAGATYTSELSNDAGFTTLVAVNGAVNSNIASNNDVFAKKLGYMSYADMVAAATNGKTIINGGYLRTNLIKAGAITANQINTVGLIAENISANTISGKTITGGTISGNTISGNTISGGTVTGTSIIGGSISGTTGTFSGEMTVGKFGNANMTISNGIAYIPIIDFGSIKLSTTGIPNSYLQYVETTGPLLRSTCSFQITGVGSVGSYHDGDSSSGAELFVYYSVNNGGTWVQFSNLISGSGSSFTTVFSASGVSAVANSRIMIRIASQNGSFNGSIIVSNFS